MSEVVCWQCSFFSPKYENPYFKELLTGGFCMHKGIKLDLESVVCENFKIKDGLFTKRSIPIYCKRYSAHNSKNQRKY